MPICTKCEEEKSRDNFPYKSNNKIDSWCKECHKEATAIFKRTKRGVIGEIYGTQKRNSKLRSHPYPKYSKEDLNTWLFNQELFHVLHKQWIDGGCQKRMKPSVDRIDDFKPYTFSNIQLMTWGENRDKQSLDIRNGVGTSGSRCKKVYQYDKRGILINTYISTAEASRKNGFTQAHISSVCRGERKTHRGYVWRYNDS